MTLLLSIPSSDEMCEVKASLLQNHKLTLSHTLHMHTLPESLLPTLRILTLHTHELVFAIEKHSNTRNDARDGDGDGDGDGSCGAYSDGIGTEIGIGFVSAENEFHALTALIDHLCVLKYRLSSLHDDELKQELSDDVDYLNARQYLHGQIRVLSSAIVVAKNLRCKLLQYHNEPSRNTHNVMEMEMGMGLPVPHFVENSKLVTDKINTLFVKENM